MTGSSTSAAAPAAAVPPLPASAFEVKALPSLLEHVTREAARLPEELRQPLLLHRVSMLLQDAVEAACMCARAHIDAALLGKHLLGSDHYQRFLSTSSGSAAAGSSSDDAGAAAPAASEPGGGEGTDAFAAAVRSTVGEVKRSLAPPFAREICARAQHCARAEPTPLAAALMPACLGMGACLHACTPPDAPPPVARLRLLLCHGPSSRR